MPPNPSRSPYASKSRHSPRTHGASVRWLGLLLGGGLLLVVGWATLGNQPAGLGGREVISPVATLQASDFHSLAVSPQDADRVWFGAHDGIRESTDGGRTWHPLPGVQGDAMSLVRHPTKPGWIYLAGHSLFKRSTDEGQTWQDVTTDLPGTDLHAFAVDPLFAQHVYTMVAGQGLFASLDGGDHWTFLPAQPPGARALTVTSGKPARVYAVSDIGVVYSADGGASWHPANTGLPAEDTYALLAVPEQPQRLYAGTANGLYGSTDGASWRAVGLSGQKVLALAATATGALRVYALTDTGRVFRLEGTALGQTVGARQMAARP